LMRLSRPARLLPWASWPGHLARDKSRIAKIICFYACCAAAVLCAKIFFSSRQLSLEALFGLAAGAALAYLLVRLPRSAPHYAGIVLLIGSFAVAELKTGSSLEMSGPFNWVPFRYQIDKRTIWI